MLKNYDWDYQTQPTTGTRSTEIHEHVSVSLSPSMAEDPCLPDPSLWSWENLRDYVIRQIEHYHGPFPRDTKKESIIFQEYLDRYGDNAAQIALYAFAPERHGIWRGAPISVSRFARSSDSFFGGQILNTT